MGIFGESGSGKTSLAEIIIGLKNLNEGKIFVDGKKINTQDKEYQNMFSYVPQNSFLINDTIFNNLVFYGNKELDANDSIAKLIKVIELEEFIDGLEYGLSKLLAKMEK